MKASQALIEANRRICQEQKQKAVARYYGNPNMCKQCGRVIPIPSGKRAAEARKKTFCSRNCSATYNNSQRPKKDKPARVKKVGSIFDGMTKAQVREKYKDPFRYKIAIGKHARGVFNRSSKEKVCVICGYDKFCEICHIQAVSDFPDSALITEINHIDNLVPLCPNHHKEHDHGLLSDADKQKLRL